MSGRVDLHCHLLWGLDDGAKTVEETLLMARALVELGYTDVAPSPHHRPQFAPKDVALARLDEARSALAAAQVPLTLHPNAECFFLEEGFLPELASPAARRLGAGAYVLVEAPYTAPLPALTDLVFRAKLKGVTPLIAHPERCMEFARKGRAAEVAHAGALLQLDLGSLTGRYGPEAKKLARAFLDHGLYAVAATDLHSPAGARQWIEQAISELGRCVGRQASEQLLGEHPRRVLSGESLEL